MIKTKTRKAKQKGLRPRLIGPPDSVNENGRAPSPQECVRRSVYLSALFREMHRPMARNPVDFGQIIDTLTEKKIPFVLTGAHAIGTWTGQPRATHDIDILAKEAETVHERSRRFANSTQLSKFATSRASWPSSFPAKISPSLMSPILIASTCR